MAWSTPIASVVGNLGPDGGTSGAIDTTGADFIIISVSTTQGGGSPSVSDSKSNSWTPLTDYADAGLDLRVRFFYCVAPTVGSGHTFSATSTNDFSSIGVSAHSGAKASSPFDAENGANTSGATSLQPGAAVPSEDNEIVFTAINLNPSDTATIDGGFSIIGYAALNPGQALGIALAYKIQTSAASANPTWSWTGSKSAFAAIATFKAEASGPTPNTVTIRARVVAQTSKAGTASYGSTEV